MKSFIKLIKIADNQLNDLVSHIKIDKIETKTRFSYVIVSMEYLRSTLECWSITYKSLPVNAIYTLSITNSN